MNFSVCLITRNEASVLPRLIHSLSEFQSRGGEICVLDTGSTDNTVELARSLGCKVKEVGTKYVHIITDEESKNINDRFIVGNEAPIVLPGDKYFDFASARNESVSMASNDWICTVDADEVFTRFNIDEIEEIIKNPGMSQLEYNFVFSHDHYGNELIKFVQSKFYHRKKMEWQGLIHELVTPIVGVVAQYDRQFLPEDIFKLEHWQNQESNRTGYLKGLAVDCFNNQEKDRNSHYFARELFWNGRPLSAAKEFIRHVEMNKWPAEKSESMIFLGDIYGALKNSDKQIEWYAKAVDTDCTRREPLIKLAQAYMSRNQPIPANLYATAALELPWHGFYGTNKSNYENVPHEILYWAKGWMGDIAGARFHIMKCLEYQRENPQYIRDTQYYFDYAANSIEGWMSFKEQLFLFEAAKDMESVIELGSWKGKSTYALCKSGCPIVTAIDTWMGSEFEPEAHVEARSGTVLEKFKNNTREFKNLSMIQKDINDAVNDIADKSVDMVFIDAGHTYLEVKNDIQKWKGKAKILLCGHDYCQGWPGVIQAVDEELGGPDFLMDTIWAKWLNKPKVSICIPTLGRPQKLNRLLNAIKQNAGYDNYEVIVKADQMPPNNVGAPTMLKKCVDESIGDFVMFLGNDVIPEPNFLREAVWEMIRRFPDLDGMIGLNDGYWRKNHVAPHFLISKKLLPYLEGEFFHTGFYHTGCDNDLLARVEKIGKYSWAEKAKIFHDHPMMSGKPEDMDALYEQAYTGPRHDADDRLYAERAIKYGYADKKWD